MQRLNVFSADYAYAQDKPAGSPCGTARLGPLVGAESIAGTVYEPPSGESTWPYHYVGVWPDDEGDVTIVQRSSCVDYWEGEG